MIYLQNDSSLSQRIFIPRNESDSSATGHTVALQSKDYEITENGLTIIHPDPGYDGISGGSIGVYVSAATGVTFQHLDVTEDGVYVPTGDSVYTGVTVQVSDSAYQDGYNDGYASGYTVGFQDGYTSGYTVGTQDGYASGSTEGYASGYTEGYASGSTDGYTSGRTDGYNDGYASGMTDGFSAGYTSGVTDTKNAMSSIEITNNGIWTSETGYSAVTVDVNIVNNQSKTITISSVDTHPAYAQGIEVTPDSGYTGLDKVTVKTDFTILNPIFAGTFSQNGDYTLDPTSVGYQPNNYFKAYQFKIEVDECTKVTLTQAQYDALPIKDNNTIYLIKD